MHLLAKAAQPHAQSVLDPLQPVLETVDSLGLAGKIAVQIRGPTATVPESP